MVGARLIPVFIFLLVFRTPTLLGQEASSDPVAFFQARQAALQRYEDGQWEQAERRLADLVRAYPLDGELWYRLARMRHRLGRMEPAIQAYRASLQHGYRYGAWVRMQVATLYAQQGLRDSSLAWLDRALEARWGDRPAIASDSAFRSLHGDPRFQAIVGRLPGRELSRDEGWRYDLKYLVDEARRMHVTGPGEPAVPPAFDSIAADLHARIPDLSNDRIVVELGRLMTALGDGHSGIYGPDAASPLDFKAGTLPLLFYLFDDGLYVIDAAPGAEQWIGSQVLAFGDRSTEAVLDELPAYVHHDNAMTVKWLGIRFKLPTLSFLHAIGAADSLTAATVTLQDEDGRAHRVTLSGGDHAGRFRRKLRPVPGTQIRPPLYLRRVDTSYWLTPLSGQDAVYFQFNQVRDAENGPSLAQFADSLRHTLVETAASNLIVDVRHNNGGNNGLLRPLIQTLVWWEQDRPGRRIVVITGRNTFSAAQNFINRVERWTDAVFVGEASSSRPNFTGEETNLLLPYSQVRGSISNRYWQDADQDDRRSWIAPDIPVTFNAADYFAGRDPALEAVVQVLTEMRIEKE